MCGAGEEANKEGVCVAVSCESNKACPTDDAPVCTPSKKVCVTAPCQQFTCSAPLSDTKRTVTVTVVGTTLDAVKTAADNAVRANAAKGWSVGEIRQVSDSQFKLTIETRESAEDVDDAALTQEVKTSLSSENLVIADEQVAEDDSAEIGRAHV